MDAAQFFLHGVRGGHQVDIGLIEADKQQRIDGLDLVAAAEDPRDLPYRDAFECPWLPRGSGGMDRSPIVSL